MNLPKGWTQEADHYSQTTDEAQTVLRLNIEPDGGWSIRGYGYAPSETTIERLLWSLEPPPDREGLARALYETPFSENPRPRSFDKAFGNDAPGRRWWFDVADTAIRLCGGVREEAPEGWPEEWRDDGYGDRVRQGVVVNHWRLPNTEPGRTAAWKLEGKDAEPREPLSITADRIAKEASNLREELARARAETRAAIESRDQADEAVATLQDLLKKANEEIEELKMRNRTLTDRLKLVESNLQQVHHDRDTQRAIVDHLRDMIVDIARGQQ